MLFSTPLLASSLEREVCGKQQVQQGSQFHNERREWGRVVKKAEL